MHGGPAAAHTPCTASCHSQNTVGEPKLEVETITNLSSAICHAGVTLAASPCGSLSFFPTAAQIAGTVPAAASVAVTSNITCTGNQVCNWPSVFSKTAQEANLAALGTSISADGLLNVAVKEYGAKQLRVFFMPSSPLFTAGASAQACVIDATPAATHKRSLLAATYSVANPATWSYTVTFSSGGSIDGGDKSVGDVGDMIFPTEGTLDVSLAGYTCNMHGLC